MVCINILSLYIHLGCFHFLTVVNNISVNMDVYVSLWYIDLDPFRSVSKGGPIIVLFLLFGLVWFVLVTSKLNSKVQLVVFLRQSFTV